MGRGLGTLQQDGGAIQFRPRQHYRSVARYNWIHDNTKFGIRCDIAGKSIKKGPERSESEGLNFTAHHNVVWGIDYRQTYKPAINITGDHQMVYNNTSFNNTVRDINLLKDKVTNWGNDHSVTRNNVTGPRGIGAGRLPADDEFPGIHDHNWMGDVSSQLVDVENRDFRPKEDAEIVGKARTVLGILTEDWIRRRDLGAYEWDCNEYWIPGYQTPEASKPIPADNARIAYAERDLIWLGGYGAREYNVYFGTSSEGVAKANVESPEFQGSQRGNIYRPEDLKMGSAYFWRIDSIGGEIVQGPVWGFRISQSPVDE
jgi:hypothetical protein